MISTFLDTEIGRITEVRNFEGWTTCRNIDILVHFSSLRDIFSGTNVRVTLFILNGEHAYINKHKGVLHLQPTYVRTYIE